MDKQTRSNINLQVIYTSTLKGGPSDFKFIETLS